MVLKEDRERGALLRRVRRVCGVSYILLRVLFVIIVLFWLLPLLLGLFGSLFPHAFGWMDGFILSAPLEFLVFGLLPAVFIGMTALILRDISKGETPFSRKQSRRMRLIAYLMFAQVALELLFSTVITALYPDGSVFLGYYYVPSSPVPTADLHLEALIFAIVFYCVSLAFEYGALLQSDSDDIL